MGFVGIFEKNGINIVRIITVTIKEGNGELDQPASFLVMCFWGLLHSKGSLCPSSLCGQFLRKMGLPLS